jgi:hypothetical protein
MIKTSFILSALLLALLLANSDLVSAERTLSKSGSKPKYPKLADSATAYKYQYKANSFNMLVDKIVNEKPKSVTDFYYTNAVPYLSEDIFWNVSTPTVTANWTGIADVQNFYERIAPRQFSYHVNSDYKVTKIGKDQVQVETRYHGIVLPPLPNTTSIPNNYEDIFGTTRIKFNNLDLIYDVFITRYYTINRWHGVNYTVP